MFGVSLPRLPPGLCRISGKSAILTNLVVLAVGLAQWEGLGADLGIFNPGDIIVAAADLHAHRLVARGGTAGHTETWNGSAGGARTTRLGGEPNPFPHTRSPVLCISGCDSDMQS